MEGTCTDTEGFLGLRKTECKYRVKFVMENPTNNNNETLSNVVDIVIKDKNLVREKNNNKIIHLDVHPDDMNNVSVSLDLVKTNINFGITICILLLLIVLCAINRKKL